MVRRTVLPAVLVLAAAIAYATVISWYTHKRTIKDVSDLMDGLRRYVKTNT